MENLTKCYCGHTTTCDCVPEQDFKDIELPQQERPEAIEEAAEKYVENFAMSVQSARQIGFKDGAKWQQERSYSEEEVLNLLTHFAVEIQRQNKRGQYPLRIKEWFEQFKKK